MDLEYSHFNAFDLLILVTVCFSILIGAFRGFVREVFGLLAWIGAAWITIHHYQWSSNFLGQWIRDPIILNAASRFSVFCIMLIMLLCIAQWFSIMVQKTFAHSVDRSLGLVFGFFRGLLVVCGAYMASMFIFPIEKIPTIVTSSKSLSWLNRGVLIGASFAPRSVLDNPVFVKNLQELSPPALPSEQLSNSLSAPRPEPTE
jgi:membrane protein required for colicin V production